MNVSKRFAIQLDQPPSADACSCDRAALALYGTDDEMRQIDAMCVGAVLRFGDTFVRRLPDDVIY